VRLVAPRAAHQREGDERFTLDAILREEAAVLDLVDARNDRAMLSIKDADTEALSADQKRAVDNIGRSPGWCSAVRNEGSFAALSGAAPVPASSGKITRHRLSRGGDRAANNALYRIALVRMSAHLHTRDYVERQVAKGRTKGRSSGCSNEPSPAKSSDCSPDAPLDDYRDLRPARQAKNLTLATVATHFGVPLITISRLERGHHRNGTLANSYRQWLTAA
jgi:hypothetical protein